MAWRRQRLYAAIGAGILLTAIVAGSNLRARPLAARPGRSAAASTPVAIAGIGREEQQQALARGDHAARQPLGAAAASLPPGSGPLSPTLGMDPAAPTRTPLPRTLTGGENDQSTWQEYRLLSWGIAFRYPRQWSVALLAPKTPGDPDIVEILAGGRALRLVRNAPGRSLDGYASLEPVAVGPVSGNKYVARGPQGELYEAVVVPQARRDAVSLIEYRLLGGDEDPVYLALFDAVLGTLRFDVGITPVGPSLPAFADYKPRQVTLPDQYSGYALPLDTAQIGNLGAYSLTEGLLAALTANGFAASPGQDAEFADLYQALSSQGRPIFVTTDSALHVYHLLFDKLLRSAERQHLAADLLGLDRQLLATAQAAYQGARGTPLEGAALRALAYFAVAVRLQDPQAPVPTAAQAIVDGELALIEAHQGWAVSPLFDRAGLPEDRKCREDYSQYVPRGHYAGDEQLQRYFKAMMWHGQLCFRLRERDEVRTALLITQALLRSRVGSRAALSVWESIYEPTTFFVGRTDDLNVYDVRNLATSVYGNLGDDPRLFADEGLLDVFIRAAKGMPAPRINSTWVGLGEDQDAATRGFRFMGQRFVVDGYVFDQLMWDRVGTVEKPRMEPRGLDVAAALGSDEAYRALEDLGDTAYAHYPEQMNKVRQEIAALPETTWGQDLYWAWLRAFSPLLREKDARFPEYMRTRAWARKDLQTALGSWTELKHDTVLYAKQANVRGLGASAEATAVGYVEPNPEVYARLGALAEMATKGLDNRALLEPEEQAALQRLQLLAGRLQAIAEKELAQQLLSPEDLAFIRGYGAELRSLTRAAADGEGTALDGHEAAIVADVATGGASILEVATGRISHLYVVIQAGQQLMLAEGGVYSYYEFAWPASERLTDERWRQMLGAGQAPPQPEWMATFTTP